MSIVGFCWWSPDLHNFLQTKAINFKSYRQWIEASKSLKQRSADITNNHSDHLELLASQVLQLASERVQWLAEVRGIS